MSLRLQHEDDPSPVPTLLARGCHRQSDWRSVRIWFCVMLSTCVGVPWVWSAEGEQPAPKTASTAETKTDEQSTSKKTSDDPAKQQPDKSAEKEGQSSDKPAKQDTPAEKQPAASKKTSDDPAKQQPDKPAGKEGQSPDKPAKQDTPAEKQPAASKKASDDPAKQQPDKPAGKEGQSSDKPAKQDTPAEKKEAKPQTPDEAALADLEALLAPSALTEVAKQDAMQRIWDLSVDVAFTGDLTALDNLSTKLNSQLKSDSDKTRLNMAAVVRRARVCAAQGFDSEKNVDRLAIDLDVVLVDDRFGTEEYRQLEKTLKDFVIKLKQLKDVPPAARDLELTLKLRGLALADDMKLNKLSADPSSLPLTIRNTDKKYGLMMVINTAKTPVEIPAGTSRQFRFVRRLTYSGPASNQTELLNVERIKAGEVVNFAVIDARPRRYWKLSYAKPEPASKPANPVQTTGTEPKTSDAPDKKSDNPEKAGTPTTQKATDPTPDKTNTPGSAAKTGTGPKSTESTTPKDSKSSQNKSGESGKPATSDPKSNTESDSKEGNTEKKSATPEAKPKPNEQSRATHDTGSVGVASLSTWHGHSVSWLAAAMFTQNAQTGTYATPPRQLPKEKDVEWTAAFGAFNDPAKAKGWADISPRVEGGLTLCQLSWETALEDVNDPKAEQAQLDELVVCGSHFLKQTQPILNEGARLLPQEKVVEDIRKKNEKALADYRTRLQTSDKKLILCRGAIDRRKRPEIIPTDVPENVKAALSELQTKAGELSDRNDGLESQLRRARLKIEYLRRSTTQSYTAWKSCANGAYHQCQFQYRPEGSDSVQTSHCLYFSERPDSIYFFTSDPRQPQCGVYWGRFNLNASWEREFSWLPSAKRATVALGTHPTDDDFDDYGRPLPQVDGSKNDSQLMLWPSTVGLPRSRLAAHEAVWSRADFDLDGSGEEYNLAMPVAVSPSAPPSPLFLEAAPAPVLAP